MAVRGHKTTGAEKPALGGPVWSCSLSRANSLTASKGGERGVDQELGVSVYTLLHMKWQSGEESACQCRRCKRLGFYPWVGKISWRRKWQLIPVCLPGKSHGQRNLAGCSLWGCKGSDMTEYTHTHTCTLDKQGPPYSTGNSTQLLNFFCNDLKGKRI